MNIKDLPKLFRGCMWDAGWEYDAPCVLYSPYRRYGFGGNSHHIDSMVEDICIDLSLGNKTDIGWCESDLKEFKWRGWSPRGFAKRKEAWHVTIKVRWFVRDGEPSFEIVRNETWGPPV